MQVCIIVHLEDSKGEIVTVGLYNQIPGGSSAMVRVFAASPGLVFASSSHLLFRVHLYVYQGLFLKAPAEQHEH